MKNLLSMTIVDKIIGGAPFVCEGDFAAGIHQARRLGYDGVELHIADPSKLDREAVRRALEQTGLRLTAIGTGRAYVNEGLSLTNPESGGREAACARLRAFIDLAAELGGLIIIGCMRGNVEAGDTLSEVLARLEESMKAVDSYAGEKGVRMVFEPINRYENNYLPTVSDVAEFIAAAGLAHTGILIDTFHMNMEEADLAEAIGRYGDKIWYAHMADSNRKYPGGGHIDFVAVLSALAAVGYAGPFSAECQPKPNKEEAASGWLRAMRELLSQVAS